MSQGIKTKKCLTALSILTMVLFAGLTGCETTSSASLSNPRTGSVNRKSTDIGWVLASNNPPVFHPRGLEKPDYRKGRWIATFSPDARWFIPHGGVNRRSEKQLEDEATKLRSRFQNTRGTLRNTGKLAADTAKIGVKTGVKGALQFAAALGGGSI